MWTYELKLVVYLSSLHSRRKKFISSYSKFEFIKAPGNRMETLLGEYLKKMYSIYLLFNL